VADKNVVKACLAPHQQAREEERRWPPTHHDFGGAVHGASSPLSHPTTSSRVCDVCSLCMSIPWMVRGRGSGLGRGGGERGRPKPHVWCSPAEEGMHGVWQRRKKLAITGTRTTELACALWSMSMSLSAPLALRECRPCVLIASPFPLPHHSLLPPSRPCQRTVHQKQAGLNRKRRRTCTGHRDTSAHATTTPTNGDPATA
jgi:hypothetical protein